MRRYVPILVAGAALIAAACSDSVAPARSTNASDLPTLASFGGGPASSRGKANHGPFESAPEITFTISPRGGRAQIAGFTLNYPANAVCDPSVSGYGASDWQKPCETLNEPITITAKFWLEDGRTHADFSPDIRFDPSKDVTLSAIVPSLRGHRLSASDRDKYSIWYSVLVGDERYYIDEASVFPELATVFGERRGRATGNLVRKIYHFSGYYVRSGRVCDDSSGDCSDAVGIVDELLQ